MSQPARVPPRAWLVAGAGTAVNLCLGILYAWSVWKNALVTSDADRIGSGMPEPHDGWVYLSKPEGTWAYSLCGLVFALVMIPGGRIQDRYGPRVGAILGGLFLAAGCVVAGLMRSYLGLVLGFGLLGGIGMGLGYAAATPAAVRWFGPRRRGLVVGIVVAGYGGAALYVSPLANWLISSPHFGLTGSFLVLGALFAVVVVTAGALLTWPPAGYVPPDAAAPTAASLTTLTDWTPRQMLATWQFYALVFLFIGSAQSGLLVIANATPVLRDTAQDVPFFAANAWLLSSFGGLVNASGRVGTGLYSDRLGRLNAYTVNGIVSALCLFLAPTIIAEKNVPLLFLVVGVAFWQYGGGLSLLPALTADYFGPKNMGFNYGLVFVGWGAAFFVPQLAAYVRDDVGFYLSGGLLLAAVVLSRFLSRPLKSADASGMVADNLRPKG